MLDVIITVSPITNPEWVKQCIGSVKEAMDLASYKINLIQAPAVPGHLGKAMHGGLVQGTNPYVVWVDDDDFVLPNAFTCLERHFEARPTAVCAREVQLLNNGRMIPTKGRHHLSAWRRDVVESVPLLDRPGRPYELIYKAAWDGIVDELSWVYVYRKYLSQALKVRATYKDL